MSERRAETAGDVIELTAWVVGSDEMANVAAHATAGSARRLRCGRRLRPLRSTSQATESPMWLVAGQIFDLAQGLKCPSGILGSQRPALMRASLPAKCGLVMSRVRAREVQPA